MVDIIYETYQRNPRLFIYSRDYFILNQCHICYILLTYCTCSLLALPLKRHAKIAADNILIFYLYLSKKIWLDFSCESSASQRIHLKHQVLFSLKNKEKNIYECCLLQS